MGYVTLAGCKNASTAVSTFKRSYSDNRLTRGIDTAHTQFSMECPLGHVFECPSSEPRRSFYHAVGLVLQLLLHCTSLYSSEIPSLSGIHPGSSPLDRRPSYNIRRALHLVSIL